MGEFYGVVYLITNTVNGKQYVGQTISPKPERYIEKHYNTNSRGRKPLYNAIRKYGREAFSSEIIWWCKDKASLDISEASFIKFFETMTPDGYNLKEGGAHGKYSEESKKKMSDAQKKVDPQIRKTQAIARSLTFSTPESKIRRKLAMKSAMSRPEVREKLRISIRRSHTSPDLKEKRKLIYSSEQTREKLGLINRGRRWANNGIINRMLKKEEELPEGWF